MTRPACDAATAFAFLEEQVRGGHRCPPNTDPHLGREVIHELMRTGKIRVCVYPRNWRTVEILTGPLAGKQTMGPPGPQAKPYKVMDASSLAEAIRRAPTGVQPHTFRKLPRRIAP